MHRDDLTRRSLLKGATVLAAGALSASAGFAAEEKKKKAKASDELLEPKQPAAMTGPDRFGPLKVGVASYTFRQVPLEKTIAAIQRLGLHYVSIKDFHLPLKSTAEERKQVVQAFKDGGITPISCGNIKLTTDEKAARQAFEYMRDVGAPVMVCAPTPDCLPLMDKLVKEYDLKLAIHNHGPEDKIFPSPYEVQKAIASLDPRIGYCIDLGHTFRAGVDPAKAIRDCKDRLYDIHMKDVSDPTIKGAGHTAEVGRGKMDIPAIAKALLEVKFAGHVGFEYEKDAADPLPGLAESVGYLRGVMTGMV